MRSRARRLRPAVVASPAARSGDSTRPRSALDSAPAFAQKDPTRDRSFSPTACPSTPTARITTRQILAQDVGIRFDGKEKTNVEEYCISEGWIKVAAGTAKDRFGRPMTIRLRGVVEPFIRGAAADA